MFDPFIAYKKNLLKNHLILEKFLDTLKSITDSNEKQILATDFAHLLSAYPTGDYVLPEIESICIELANTIPKFPLGGFKENSVMHIMTIPYATGGHTRVVERWIEQAPKHEKHSVIFTEEDNVEASAKIKELVAQKGGITFLLPQKELLAQKALILRKMASSYQTIVLHIHPYDTLPLVAFGSSNFKRPIVLFNHSDHSMWYGTSIADVVAEFRTFGMALTQNKRACDRSFLLGLPQDTRENQTRLNKDEARKILGLPLENQIFLTIGSPAKYRRLLSLDFGILAQQLLDIDSKNHIIVIGVESGVYNKWDKLCTKYPNRVDLIGPADRKTMFLYIAACDIVLDSFPMSSCMALMDAISYDRPVLSLECPVGQHDFIVNSPAYCTSMSELLKKIVILLKNKTQREFHIQSLKKAMEVHTNDTLWQKSVGKLYTCIKADHKIYSCPVDNAKINKLLSFITENNIQDIDAIQNKTLNNAFNAILSETYNSLDVYRLIRANSDEITPLLLEVINKT